MRKTSFILLFLSLLFLFPTLASADNTLGYVQEKGSLLSLLIKISACHPDIPGRCNHPE
jgi:hypothetical protein